MEKWYKAIRLLGMAGTVAFAALAGGCAGPSTRVLPREQVQQEQQVLSEGLPVLEEANPFYIQEALGVLAKGPRVMGSEGEEEAVRYLSQMLGDYGYQVKLQEFQTEDEEGNRKQGVNVCAVRQANAPDADMVLIVGSHDTAAGSPGAHQGASGVVTMLEAARLVAALPTDTELRFVSLSGSCTGDSGARHYLSTLSKEEIQRMVGVIRLGALGASGSEELSMRTMDGHPVLMGELFNVSSRDLYLRSVRYLADSKGGQKEFVRNRIPAVCLEDRWSAYGDGTFLDRAETVDIEQLTRVANILAGALSSMMSEDSPSLIAKSRYYNDLRDGTYVQEPEEAIPFGETYARTRQRMGEEGHLSAEHTDDGASVQVYQYPVKWFGVGQIILTGFYYRDGRLTELSLDADGAGVGPEEMKERISACYGEPEEEEAGPNGGVNYRWEVPQYRIRVTLERSSDGYEVSVGEYAPAVQELYAGTLEDQEQPEDMRERKLLSMVRGLFAADWAPYVESVELFTDGLGGAGCEPEFFPSEESPSGVSCRLRIDVQDVMEPDGTFRDRTDFVRQVLTWQGQILEYRDPACKEAFGARFEQQPDGPAMGEVLQAEELDGTSGAQAEGGQAALLGLRPGEDQAPLPGFAESYRWFVLAGDSLQGEGPFWDRLRFFSGYPEAVESRQKARAWLRLEN